MLFKKCTVAIQAFFLQGIVIFVSVSIVKPLIITLMLMRLN
jgi:hypothetical protein